MISALPNTAPSLAALIFRERIHIQEDFRGGKTNGRTSVRPFGNIKIDDALNEAYFDFDFLVFFFAIALLLV